MSTTQVRTSDVSSAPQVSVRYLRGVGPERAKLFSRLGIETVEDLLYSVPRRYEDRSQLRQIALLRVGQSETVRAHVKAMRVRTSRKGLPMFELKLDDGSGRLHAIWFRQPYLQQILRPGLSLVLYGQVDQYLGSLQMVNPEYEILSGDQEEDTSIHTGRIVPIYSLTEHLHQRAMRTTMFRALEQSLELMVEFLPDEIRRRQELLPLAQAIQQIHFPESSTAQKAARHRLVFDELLLLQLAIALKRASVKTPNDGIQHALAGDLVQRFETSLPFSFTESQHAVMEQIGADLASPKRMNRLLQGDVGSGKTIVATKALLTTVQNGYQGALMVPTEILAEQHVETLNGLCADTPVTVTLLTSGLTAAARTETLQRIAAGDVDIVVGTHALIQEDVAFHRLGLVVIDEQHKFGVVQRAELARKGLTPDILVMTATPIPRTLALTVYGDLDVSTLHGLPPGRQPIQTRAYGEAQRDKALKLMTRELEAGHQAYVVYPLVEESEHSDLKAATQMYEELAAGPLATYRVGMIHGRLSSQDKDATMRAFKQGELQVLVSTIVIEVGIDVPNATVMVIEEAHRFGLSQLHQLRGRVGRGAKQSVCLLIGDPKSQEARERLQAMVDSSDGFVIAERDLELRGPGEFFGTRQSGIPETRIANLVRDRELMEVARHEAFRLIDHDPALTAPEHVRLRERLVQQCDGLNLDLLTVS